MKVRRKPSKDSPYRVTLGRAIVQQAPNVVRGVKLLNRKLLPDWHKKVSISDLELASPSVCVLGQLAVKSAIRSAGFELADDGQYSAALTALGLDMGSPYGFDQDPIGPYRGECAMYSALNHLWEAAIKLTRKGEKVTKKSLLATVIY